MIVKDAVDNNAQDFAFTTTGDGLTNFTLDDDTGAVGENTTYINTETFEAVVPGVYTVTETPVDGWVTTIVCVDSVGAGTASTGTDGVATINVDPGETVTCTYTNTDVRGSIVIVKDAVDNNAQDFAFTTTGDGLTNFTLDDDAGAIGQDTVNSNTITFDNIIPDATGTYTVTETPADGWVTTIACDDGSSTSPSTGTDGVATINVDPGETVTCTYTNTQLGAIEIIKDAVPDSTEDFSFTTTGTGLTDFTLSDEATEGFTDLLPGVYTVAETPLADWTLANIVCTSSGGSTFDITNAVGDDATEGFEPDDDRVEVTLAPGDLDVSCTFINTDNAETTTGTITIIKDSVPDDGQDFSFDHDISPSTPFVLDDNNAGTTPNELSFTDVEPGAYSVTELGVPEWEVADIVCTSTGDSTFTFTGSAIGSSGFETGDVTVNILLAPGDNDVVCTFVNDQKGTITIAEDAVDFELSPMTDAQDFGFAAAGTPTVLTSPFTLDDDAGAPGQDATSANTEIFEDVEAGTYTVTQTPVPDGWVLSRIDCTSTGGSTFDITNEDGDDATEGFQAGDDRVVITLVETDDTAKCTFVNQDVRGSIVIVKDAVDNNTADFEFEASWFDVADEPDFVLDDDAGAAGQDTVNSNTITFDNIIPDATGTYTVTETPVDGWVTTIACDDDSSTSPSTGTDGVTTINVDPSETVTCTYTNTNVRGSIVIIKDTVNNNAQDFAFTTGDGLTNFTLDDDAGAIGQDTEFSNTVTFDNIIPDATGTYTVTETPVDGWDTTIVCVDSVGGGTASTGTDGVTTINVSPSETVTCTYTNTDVRGSIVIIKDTVNNNAQDFAFTTTGDGLTNFTLDDDAGAIGQDTEFSNTVTLSNIIPDATGTYTVTETPVDGWDTTIVCVDSVGGGTASTGTDGVTTINVDPSETVACTYTNTQQGTITIIKDTLPDDDVVFEFTHDITSDPVVDTLALNDNGTVDLDTQTFLAVPASPAFTFYTVAEAAEDGWDLTNITCTTRTGDSKFNIANGSAEITLAPGDGELHLHERQERHDRRHQAGRRRR